MDSISSSGAIGFTSTCRAPRATSASSCAPSVDGVAATQKASTNGSGTRLAMDSSTDRSFV
jgi:hypothetical protein